MGKATVYRTVLNTSLHSRGVPIFPAPLTIGGAPTLFALRNRPEVTSIAQQVEHQPHKLKDRVQIPRRPAYRATIQKHFFPLAQCNLIFPEGAGPRMDYTQFLQKSDEVLRLPYFAGKSVCDEKLTYRLRDALQPGWYQFRKSGRYLTAENPVAPELEAWKLQRVVGYLFRGSLITNDSQDRLFGLPVEEDLPKFSPVAARKWFDGHLLYDGQEFETEIETRVRDAFEEERPIDQIKGVTPAL